MPNSENQPPTTPAPDKKPLEDNEYSIAKIEMEIENLKDERPALEESASTSNMGCALAVAGVLLAAFLSIWFGIALLIIGLVIAASTGTSKDKAKENLENNEKKIKMYREALLKLKESGEPFITLDVSQIKKPTVKKLTEEELLIAEEQKKKDNKILLIVVGVLIAFSIIVIIVTTYF